VIRVLPQIPWHEAVCLKQSIKASHPENDPPLVLSVVDGREAEVLGRPAWHAKIRADNWPPPQTSSYEELGPTLRTPYLHG
jgi:hypothetical protein